MDMKKKLNDKKEECRFFVKNKKGLTTKYLITIIILIISFGIIMLFFIKYDFVGGIDKEACHQSVVYKASVPEIKDRDLMDIELKCKVENICISYNSKGNCDKDFQGEKYITKQIIGEGNERENEVNKIFADALYECWWMMGQGKIQVFTRDSDTKKYCNICNRIVFDEEIKNEIGRVNGITKYLTKNNYKGSEKTYWQYITNSEANYIHNYSESLDYIDVNKQTAILFLEVQGGDYLKLLIEVAGGCGGAGAIAGAIIGSAVPVAGSIIGGGLGAMICYIGVDEATSLFDENKDSVSSGVIMRDYNFDSLNSLGCS